MMGKITQMKTTDKVKVVNDDKTIMDYINDPYFVKKREMGAAFLKKVGLPESFKSLKLNRQLFQRTLQAKVGLLLTGKILCH
jgi:hypothetical protein